MFVCISSHKYILHFYQRSNGNGLFTDTSIFYLANTYSNAKSVIQQKNLFFILKPTQQHNNIIWNKKVESNAREKRRRRLITFFSRCSETIFVVLCIYMFELFWTLHIIRKGWNINVKVSDFLFTIMSTAAKQQSNTICFLNFLFSPSKVKNILQSNMFLPKAILLN